MRRWGALVVLAGIVLGGALHLSTTTARSTYWCVHCGAVQRRVRILEILPIDRGVEVTALSTWLAPAGCAHRWRFASARSYWARDGGTWPLAADVIRRYAQGVGGEFEERAKDAARRSMTDPRVAAAGGRWLLGPASREELETWLTDFERTFP